ncbi:MAG: hypothetical protein Q8L81_14560 [Bacteroidota bacterium]|nr:hypothetical protein [Bacteroidota bacterium]
MKTKKNLLPACILLLLVVFVLACKKPKSGNYTYEESGKKSTHLKEGGGTYTITTKDGFSNTADARIKNKSNSTLYIDNVAWDINGDSVTNRNSSTTITNSTSSIKSSYSYMGLISGKKSIEGTFIRVQTYYSFTNIRVDSASGTFKYQKK